MTRAIVDLSAIFWRCWHATADEDMSEAGRRTYGIISDLYSDFSDITIAIDSPPYKRRAVYPDYKAGRDHPIAAIEELEKLIRKLQNDGWIVAYSEGMEADDVIAALVKKHGQTVVFGTDKDLLQAENVALFDPFSKKWKTAVETLGVPVAQVVDYLALTGDKSDNIPGVPGIGPKTAIRMLEKYGSVKGIVSAALEQNDDFTDKTRQNILASMKSLELGLSLIKLEEDCPIMEKEKQENHAVVDPETVALPGDNIDTEQKTEIVIDEKPREQKKTGAIIRQDVPRRVELEPTSWQDAWRISTAIANSGLYIHSFRNAEAILAIIMKGRSLGLDAITSLDSIHMIKGKPTMSAQLIVGLVLASHECLYFDCIEFSATSCTWVTKRRGSPHETRRTFTMTEAADMQLDQKDNWKKQPAVMLQWRCAVALARQVFPDLILGIYSTDELDEVA